MRTGLSIPMILVLAIATAIAPAAEGHGAGSPAVGARGSFVLTPTGTRNDTLHAFLADFGLPIHAGDDLRFSWRSENGSGPPIHFEIHAHPQAAGYVLFYNSTARSDNGTWSVPGQEPYMVYWQNPNPGIVNLSYAFTLIPPPPGLWLVILLVLVGSAPLTLVAIGAIWWFARRKRQRTRPPS